MNIKTQRTLIRELIPEDWKRLKQIAVDFRRSAYVIYDRPLPTEDEEMMALTKRFADSGLFFGVFLQETEDMIGYICFHDISGSYDLGYCFHSAYHGKGYAFESCSAMLRYMAESRNAKRFTAGTALKNEPSCKLLRKLGFILAETETLSFHKDEAGKDIIFQGGNFIFDHHE